jgi:hypothetical protein
MYPTLGCDKMGRQNAALAILDGDATKWAHPTMGVYIVMCYALDATKWAYRLRAINETTCLIRRVAL